MPTYQVSVAGKTYEVQIPDPGERPVRAIVDGQVFEVRVDSELGSGLGTTPSATTVTPQYPVTQPTTPAPAATESPASSSGDSQVTAPLPGTIVSISVQEGEAVSHGQELCILEAMKMNNPIRATQAGVVKEIKISVGEQVQHGAPLMVIEAEKASAEA